MQTQPRTQNAGPRAVAPLLSWSVALALICFAVALFRGAVAVQLASGGAMLAFVAVALETGSALAAGFGVLFGRAWTWLALALFGAAVLLEAIAHVFVYGTAPWLVALAGCVAVGAALMVFALLIRPGAPAGRL